MPPSVTIVAHEVGTTGGMERQLGELVRGLLARGYRVAVVARSCELPPQPELRWHRIRGPRRPFPLWYAWFFVLGSLAVRRHARGLVHTTGALVFSRADLSTVHFCHRAFAARPDASRAGGRSLQYRLNAAIAGWMSRVAERYCYRPAITLRLVAVSNGVAGELHDFFPGSSVSVIPNGVDTAAFAPDRAARAQVRSELGVTDEALVALFVGGEWERKGLRYAMEALTRAPGWQLVVVGRGDRARFEALGAELGIRERLHFEGPSTEPAPYYACADAFLLPTSYETFSLVTYEAAASGVPLLVTRVSGVDEILEDGRNGWFIERDAHVIAKRLQELGRDEALRRRMGEAARQDSARFGWSSAVDAYDALYRELAQTEEKP